MATKKQNSDQSKTPQNAYFLSLELENVRCFGEKQTIDFSDGNGNPKQWTIILGDNGTGKTTILRSLVSMLPINDFKIKTHKVPMCFGLPFMPKSDVSIILKDWVPFRYKTKNNNPNYVFFMILILI